MQTRIIICVFISICSFCLSSCNITDKKNSITNFNSEDYMEGVDNQVFFNKSFLCRNDQGYYYFRSPFLYFFDEKAEKDIKVCGLPNCKHDNEKCNSFFNPVIFNTYSLWYFNGKIYMDGQEENDRYTHYLYQISEDGSERKRICFLYKSEEAISDFSLIIHRGYAYYVNNANNDLSNKESTLYRVSLSSKENPEKIFEYDGYGAGIYRIAGYGNYVYFEAGAYEDAEGNGYTSNLFRMGYKSDDSEIILEKIWPNDYLIIEKYLYYFKDDNNLYRLDIEKSEERLFYRTEGRSYLSQDGKYLYIDNGLGLIINQSDLTERKIDVVDLTGNKVDSISISRANECLFGDADYLFILSDGKMMAFDKSQIGTVKRDWITLH